MPPRSRLWAKDRSTISARRRIACLPTAVLRRCGIDLRQVLLRRGERALDRRGVPVIGGMERRRDDDAGIEIDGVLGLVGQVRPTVLQLGDLGLWIGPENCPPRPSLRDLGGWRQQSVYLRAAAR